MPHKLYINKISKYALVGHGYSLYNFYKALEKSSLINPIIITHKTSKSEKIKQFDKKIYKNIFNLKNKTKIHEIRNFDYKKFLNILSIHKIDYIISCSSKFIFNDVVIKAYKDRIFNLHSSELPKYRGGAVFSWKILKKEHTSCASMHKIEKKLDTGNLILQTLIKKHKADTNVVDLIKESNLKFDELIKKFIFKVENKKKFSSMAQKEKNSVYLSRLNSSIDGKINWNWDGQDIVTFVKAMSKPFNGSFTHLNEKKKKIKINIFKCFFYKDKKNHPFLNGRIFFENDEFIKVFVNNGIIKIFLTDIKKKLKIKFIGKRFVD